jgi:hypothetical protein
MVMVIKMETDIIEITEVVIMTNILMSVITSWNKPAKRIGDKEKEKWKSHNIKPRVNFVSTVQPLLLKYA